MKKRESDPMSVAANQADDCAEFERAVDTVVKAPPQHRASKTPA